MHPDSKAHGGTALIIRSCIKHYEIDEHQRDFLVISRWKRGIVALLSLQYTHHLNT